MQINEIDELIQQYFNKSFVQPISIPLFSNLRHFSIIRDDTIHPYANGNKLRKLLGSLKNAAEFNKKHIVSFGGAFSNHALATAAVCKELKWPCTLFIRGNEHTASSNFYLQTMEAMGAKLIFTERNNYAKNKYELFLELEQNDKTTYFIDEGGKSELAEEGIANLRNKVPFNTDILVLASATATTAKYLAKNLETSHPHCKIWAVPVLKNFEEQIVQFSPYKNTELIIDHTLGGYAKKNSELENFCTQFMDQSQIEIEPIYTGKALFALHSEINKNNKLSDLNIVFLHTGGVFANLY